MSHNRPHESQDTPFLQRLTGTFPATFINTLIFHPADTSVKRLVKNKNPIASFYKNPIVWLSDLNKVIFLNANTANFASRYFSLYAGFNSGLLYKLLQFTYKFSFQPEVAKFLKQCDAEKAISSVVSPTLVAPFVQALSGSITGFFEVGLLPVDMAKIKKQNNPELKKLSTIRIIANEWSENGLKGIYKSAGITVARNVPGSGALFLFPALTYSHVLHKKKSEASTKEQIVANGMGGVGSLFVSSPQDVIKIRMQSSLIGMKTLLKKQEILLKRQEDLHVTYQRLLETDASFLNKDLLSRYQDVLSRNCQKIIKNHELIEHAQKSAFELAKEIWRHEGGKGFFKGMVPKLLIQGPKLAGMASLADGLTNQVKKFGLFSSSHPQEEMEKVALPSRTYKRNGE